MGAPSEAEDPTGLSLGDRVTHAKWGAGTVGQVEDGQVTVVFDTVGYRTLDASLVAERGLLERLAE